MGLKNCVECIKRNKSFLITAHTNLEGDALGSELGFLSLIRKLGKEGFIVNEDGIPHGYDFLPGKGSINKLSSASRNIKFDCLVVLDCSDLKRTGDVYKLGEGKPVLNIDHHISNTYFAGVNWVDPAASSASEMVYRLFKKMRLPLDKDTALALYSGIVVDTGSFHYSNTSGLTHKAAAELLSFGIKPSSVYRDMYENTPFKEMKLLAGLLAGIKCESDGRIAWFQLRRDILKRNRHSVDLGERLLVFARAIKNVEVAVLFKESIGARNEVRVNFRSQGKVDVNKVAGYFGGGGHKAAAGATIKGRIEQVSREVLKKIKESL